MKKIKLVVSVAAATVFFSGCYTQLLVIQDAPSPSTEEVSWVIDSTTGDTVKVVKQTDTVHIQDHQTCIWERDLMGYPRLYCYDSFYPRDWYYYNNSPWWYSDYPYYYQGRYYSGRGHGRSRWHGESGGVTGRTEPLGPSGSSMSPRVRGISETEPGPRGGSVRSGTTARPTSATSANSQNSSSASGEIIIPRNTENKPVIIHDRGRGMSEPARTESPSPQSTPPAASEPPRREEAKVAPSPAPAPSGQTVQPSSNASPGQSSPSGDHGSGSSHQRKPRSW